MSEPTIQTDVAAKVRLIKQRMVLPAIAAPMFLVSGPQLVVSACKAGIIGAFPTINARTTEVLKQWLEQIKSELTAAGKAPPGKTAPWAANLIVHRSSERFEQDLKVVLDYQPEMVITALGSPGRVAGQVHEYGGIVFADVNSVLYARKAVDAGADGLCLVCAGAGGHTGQISPFTFVPSVREFFDGPLIVAGGICDGAGVAAIEALGADFAYFGTRFIAARESLAPAGYRNMLVASTEEDLILTAHFTGVPANYLRPSIERAGLDPASLGVRKDKKFDSRKESRAWRDIWSAGQGLRAVKKAQPIAEIVSELKIGYDAARGRG